MSCASFTTTDSVHRTIKVQNACSRLPTLERSQAHSSPRQSGQAEQLALWRVVRQAHRPDSYLPALEPPDPWTHPLLHEALLTAVQQLPDRLQAVLNAIDGLDSPCSRAALGRRWGPQCTFEQQFRGNQVCLDEIGLRQPLQASDRLADAGLV